MMIKTYRFFRFLTMSPTQLSINLMTDEQGIRSVPLAYLRLQENHSLRIT